MTEVGLGIQGDKRPGSYARIGAAAEALGLDVLSVYGDLGFQPSMAPLLEIAAATDRVRLGPACLNPSTLHPVEIAGQIAWLDLVSEGRAYLGLARGAWLDGLDADRPDAVGRLEESAAVVRLLLAGERDGFVGRHFRIDPGITLRYARHRETVPLLIGSWGRRTLRMAGRIADEVKIGGSANPAMVAVARERVGSDAVGIVMGAVSVVDEDGDAARRLARREVAMYLDVVAALDPTVDVDPEVLLRMRDALAIADLDAAAAVVPDALLSRFAFAGTPHEVAEHVAALFDAGAHRVELGTPHGIDSLHGVELIGSQVVPQVGR